jgi:methylglutaconyl-CoA hydratase
MTIISVATANKVTTNTLNRPQKRNAMNGEMIQALSQHLRALADQPTSQILVFRGEGEHFCAGADIDWMQKIAMANEQENYTDAQSLADLLYQLYIYPKPTIALVHGMVLGGGMGIVAACDIALARGEAQFGFPEVKIGLVPSTISPYILAAIGERAARYYFLTGERFDANEAKKLGLIHQVTDDLSEASKALTETLAKNGPQALGTVKQLIRHVNAEPLTELLAQKTATHLANLRSTAEAQEGLKSFLEKRKPNWVHA